ncbi:hypothetical protein LL965_21425 [Xanthomonas cassavae CFBP 4642]|uniref:Uncharacterized protein n=1 Tax=Xanthomonas cassavae CFBP 4642 TaxID=1219375 RepID=A0ABS8HK89_9XANT|nr:hypothetical protein [Xanthomonas cassavae]MCC4622493.1 hypothetical protein [Xanthomonas cassavae CFBP 4642]
MHPLTENPSNIHVARQLGQQIIQLLAFGIAFFTSKQTDHLWQLSHASHR